MSLDPLFKPRSVAIIGASARPYTIGHRILTNLMEHGFTGPLFPVNPKGGTIHNLMVYRSIIEIPSEVDLAHIIVKNTLVKPVLVDCAEKGVRVAIVNTSGFSETGPEGLALEEELVATARELGIRVFGPNCQGVMNTDPAVSLYSNFTFARMVPGHISILAQGGGVAEIINNYFGMNEIGTRMYASNGNASDISIPEILAYYGDDPETRVIVLHVESFRRPARFLEVAREVAHRKPILALKSGYTEEGARAVSSHTGGMMGRDTTSDILFERAGVLRFNDLTSLCETAKAFECQPVPRGPRVGIVTNAGSPAIVATDEVVRYGLVIPPLSDRSADVLREKLKGFAAVSNPIDMAATASAEEYGVSFKALLDDEGIDSVIVCFITPFFVDTEAIAREIARLAAEAEKTLLCVAMTNENWKDTVDIVKKAGVPVYYFPEAASQVLYQMERYRRLRDRPPGEPKSYPAEREAVDRILAEATIMENGFLSGPDVNRILDAYGIPRVREGTAGNFEQLRPLAAGMGYPVVLKVMSREVVHKSDSGGVLLDIKDDPELKEAFDTLHDRFGGLADVRYTVQEQVSGGVEVIVGAAGIGELGHSIMFGLGGIFVETLEDVTFRLAPISEADAGAMLDGIKASGILKGARGRPPVNREALVEILLRTSNLVAAHPAIAELDLNPVFAHPERDRTRVVDARIRIER
jgi:acetyltransferase